MAQETTDTFETKTSSYGYQSAVAVSIVAGVFLIIVLCLLSFTFYQVKIPDEHRTLQLEAMKKQLSSTPDDENLLMQIRELDLRIRQDSIHRRNFLKRGAYLAVGSLVVFLTALKIACLYKRKLPTPTAHPDIRHQQTQAAMNTRFAVTVAFVVLGTVSLFFAMSKTVEF